MNNYRKIYIFSPYRKHRYELGDEAKKNNRIFIDKELANKVILDCRTTAAHKFGEILGFKQYDVPLSKEQSVLTKIKKFIWRKKQTNTILCVRL